MESKSIVNRRAGLLEQYHITRYALGFDTCVINAARYMVPNKQDLDQITLFCGLRTVIESHPALGVRLVAKSLNKASFERLQRIHMSEIVEFSDSHNLQAVIEEQLMRPLPTTSPTLPLWRLVVMSGSTICFVWHHSIGDGISGLAFHRSLLHALQATVDQKTTTDDIAIPSTRSLAPIIEKVMTITPSWREAVSGLWDLLAPVAWTSSASAWTGSPVSNAMCFRTRVRLIEITSSDAATFLEVCKNKKATITSAFYTLAIATLSSLISTKKCTTISSYVPTSLRGIANVTDEVICDYASTMHFSSLLNSTFRWKEASCYASRFKFHRPRSAREVGMLKFLCGDYASFCRSMMGKKRKGGFEISNVGRFENLSNGKDASACQWAIGRMVFAQSDPIAGSAIKMNVVGDSLGGINLSVIWEAGVISDTFGDEFVSRFKSGVEKLLSTDLDTLSLQKGLVET